MKKNLLALSVAAAALAFTTVASAAIPNTWYAGVRGGYAHIDTDDFVTDAQGYGIYNSDTAGYGLGLFGGYSVNQYFSVELGYNYFDGFEISERELNRNNTVNEWTSDFAIHGPELGLRVSIPLTDAGTDLFVRGGGFYAMYTGDLDDCDAFSPFVGAGVNFALTDNWALRLGYDRYFDVIDAADVDMDLDYAYLTLGYVFGDRTPAPVAPQPVTKTVTTSYNLDASALFGFDSDKLTEEGHAAVSQVVVDAQNANLDFVAYDVKGYTDPIGNAEYNKGLSLRRAQAVSAELQAKGVPAGAITVAGLGATESTVGDACDGLPRNEKLKCYAPDRRVVVNVTGSTTTTEQQ